VLGPDESAMRNDQAIRMTTEGLAALDWESLGRTVRRRTLDAVAEHCARKAREELGKGNGDRVIAQRSDGSIESADEENPS